MHRPIALLSDFGTQDPYVGIAKAVMAGIAPGATFLDITHDIPPQNVAAASFVLAAAVPYLPDGAVVWAVVDPGVGTPRAAVAVEGRVDGRRIAIVAPDNGLLTESLDLFAAAGAVGLDDPSYHLQQTSSTFHGRDVFAPAAAHLARGADVADLGASCHPHALARLALSKAIRSEEGWIGTIRWADRFGDLITNIPADAVRQRAWRVQAGSATIEEISLTFGSVPEGADVAYVGSWRTLELAVRGGSAAERWGLQPGDEVRLIAD